MQLVADPKQENTYRTNMTSLAARTSSWSRRYSLRTRTTYEDR